MHLVNIYLTSCTVTRVEAPSFKTDHIDEVACGTRSAATLPKFNNGPSTYFKFKQKLSIKYTFFSYIRISCVKTFPSVHSHLC